MERNIIDDVQEQDNSTGLLSNSAPKAVARGNEQGFAAAGLPHLSKLSRLLAEDRLDTRALRRFRQPIQFFQLEMLEAELRNQGILPRTPRRYRTVSQQSAHEASVWRWRARRFGADGDSIRFELQLPSYLVKRAADLLSNPLESGPADSAQAAPSWRRLNDSGVMRDELLYLEQFAAYLVGAYDEPTNRYQRGLNLVLHVLTGEAETEEAERNELRLCLPLSKPEFIRQLKVWRSAD